MHDMCVFIFPAKIFAVSENNRTFATTKPVKTTDEVESYWYPAAENTVCKDSQREKDVYERYLRHPNLENLNRPRRYRNRSVRVGDLYPLLLYGVYISRRGPTGCLSLDKAISRAWMWDKRVQATHVFFISISNTNAELG